MSQETTLDPQWLAALRAGAEVAPLRPRVPLCAGRLAIGSVEPEFLSEIAPLRLPDGREVLQKQESLGGVEWWLNGDVSSSLARVAQALREAGLAGAWRDELLAVHDEQGRRVGVVERGAVRPLGIATEAVHLTGCAPDGRIWVQQRALTKANDPGLWDTLVGGMVSAEESIESALLRETWEEAGLRLPALSEVARGGRVVTRRPSSDGRGSGYVVEEIAWYGCVVPAGMVPDNQDGEVAQFRLMARDELLGELQRGMFTTEAALILAQALGL